jgi:hypothetical protein
LANGNNVLKTLVLWAIDFVRDKDGAVGTTEAAVDRPSTGIMETETDGLAS